MTDLTENDRKAMFKEAVRNVEFCAELVIKQLQGEERNSQLKELKTVLLEYCDLDNNWKHEKLILNQIEQSLAEESNLNKIDEMYANLRRKQIDSDPKKHEWYLDLERKIKQLMVSEDPECNIVSTGTTQSVLDPFTKCRMVEPVKNVLCGHSYEKSSVLKFMNRTKGMKCPVVGCAYQGFFFEHHLVVDEDMMRQLRDLENK